MKTPNWSELGPYFVDDDRARELLESMRWPNGPKCPHCGASEPYSIKPGYGSTTRRGLYKCRAKECRRQFTVTVKSVFESSHVRPSQWLQAIYLQCASKKGISALQLKRMLGGSYRKAWFICHRLREAMRQEPFASKLSGVVECDEVYVGARHKRGTRRGRPGPDSHKTPVVALIERGSGRVRATTMPRVTSENLSKFIFSHVEKDAELQTDDYFAYRGIGEQMKRHGVVKHSNSEYVRGNDYTNTVEGFFGLLQRGINGTFHHVSRGHLARYVDEFGFRYEHRKVTDAERATLLVQAAGGKRLLLREPAREGTAGA